MKVGEWYTNPSSSTEYVIRITLIDSEQDRDGEYKTFCYFYMNKNKKCGEKKSAMYNILKDFTKIKEKDYINKLEKFYKTNNGPNEQEQLDSFIRDL